MKNLKRIILTFSFLTLIISALAISVYAEATL